MQHFTHNLNGVVQVRFTLTYVDYDITNWSTQGQNGFWMGVGYESSVMAGADITQCQMTYSNNTNNDQFVCNDRYATGQQLPTLDTIRNTVDVSTTVSIRASGSSLLATFTAVYDRAVNTGDVQQDNSLMTSSQNSYIWAFGELSNGVPMQHL